MNKYEKLRSSLICHFCCLIYENPVKLPCKKSICKSHLLDSNGNFQTSFGREAGSIKAAITEPSLRRQQRRRPGQPSSDTHGLRFWSGPTQRRLFKGGHDVLWLRASGGKRNLNLTKIW